MLQTDGLSEKTIQMVEDIIVEDMLRARVGDFKGKWGEHLQLVEFSYNNSYHLIIGMLLYEALHGRKCRNSLYWLEAKEKKHTSPETVKITNKQIETIQTNMQAVQDR